MKHILLVCTIAILAAAMLAGCVTPPATTGTPNSTPAATLPTAAPTAPPTEAPTEAPTQPAPTSPTEATKPEEGTAAYYLQVTYASQVEGYRTALSQQWDEAACAGHGVSPLLPQHYGSDPLANIGAGLVDLNNDGSLELIIGVVSADKAQPLVLEIWSLVDGVPYMVAQSDAQNRYYLQYSQDDEAWYVALEITRSEDHHGLHYLVLQDGGLEVIQAIVYHAAANPDSPWFMAYDKDMDTSNDESIQESIATAITESIRKFYTAADYTSFDLLPQG